MVRKLWKTAGLAAAGGICSLLGAAAWLTTTEGGWSLLVSSLQRLVPAVRVQGVSGTFSEAVLTGVSYEQDGVKLQAERLAWSLRWRSLLSGSIELPYVRTRGLALQMPTPSGESPSKPSETPHEAMPTLPEGLPRVSVEELTLQETSVRLPALQATLGRFTTSLRWADKTLRVERPRMSALSARTTSDEVSAPIDLAALEGEWRQRGLSATLPGDVRLPFALRITNFEGNDWLWQSGSSATAVRSVRLGALYEAGRLTVSEAVVTVSDELWASLSGSVTTSDAWPMKVRLRGSVPGPARPLMLEADLTGRLKGELALQATTTGAASTQATLTLQAAKPEIPVRLEAALLEPWTIPGKEELCLSQGRVAWTGSVVSGRLAVSARGEAVKASPRWTTDLTLNAETELTQASAVELKLLARGAVQGELSATAKASWRQGVSAQGTLNLRQLGLRLSETGVNVKNGDGRMTWTASLREGGLSAAMKDAVLSATVNGRATSVAADFQYERDEVLAHRLAATVGRNRIEMQGRVGFQGEPSGTVNLLLDMPHLEDFSTVLSGRVKGGAALSGTVAAPVITTDLSAVGVTAPGFSLQSAQWRGGVAPQKERTWRLSVRNLAAAGRTLRSARLELTGRWGAHRLSGELKEEAGRFDLALEAAGSAQPAEKSWQGTLQRLAVNLEKSRWRLEAPVSMAASAERVRVGTATLASGASRVVLSETLVEGARFRGGVDRLSIALKDFEGQLPPGMKVRGRLEGDARVDNATGTPVWKTSLRLSEAAFSRDAQGGRGFEPLALSAGLQAEGRGERLSFDFNGEVDGAPLVGQGVVEGEKLSGRLQADRVPLKGGTLFLPPGTTVQGYLSGDLVLAGRRLAPRLVGDVLLADFSAASSELPLTMEKSRLALKANGASLDVDALIRTAKGEATLAGTLGWEDLRKPTAHLTLTSDGVDVALEQPVVRLRVVPDLAVELNDGTALVTGQVRVPRGFVGVTELPEGAAAVSSDEVLVDEEKTPRETEAALLRAAVKVVLEDRVAVNVMGLKSRLSGTLLAQQEKGRLSLNGQVRLRDGTFKAYGQDLQIEKGLLTFTGVADNPALDFEAVRSAETTEDGVRSGVRVTGTAASPQVTLFSDPAMSEEARLSYLLTGHGLDGERDEDNSAFMTTALLGIGASQTGRVVESVGKLLGIRGLAVDTAGSGEDTQVVVSGYVLPGLQVKYGMGVFDALTTLTLKYRLLPQLYLQAVSGETEKVGLLWKFRL